MIPLAFFCLGFLVCLCAVDHRRARMLTREFWCEDAPAPEAQHELDSLIDARFHEVG